jgi:hypothetical protein
VVEAQVEKLLCEQQRWDEVKQRTGHMYEERPGKRFTNNSIRQLVHSYQTSEKDGSL